MKIFNWRVGNIWVDLAVITANAWETAQVNQWVDYSHTTIFPHLYPILRAVFGLGDAVDSDAYNNAVKEIKEIAKILNTHLQGKTHLVSNRITVADIAVAVQFIPLYQTILDAGFRKAMPNVGTWLEALVKLPEVVRRVGNVKFAGKAIKATHVLEKKKEEPKPAAAPKKVEKATEGMDHFFQHYDPEGYTIYFVHYDKYEGEGVVLYQTSNLMNGFLQRMDEKFRNYTFSMMAILGDEPNLEIQGVWMFRGKGIPQEMIDHPQFEYYQRRELDVKNEADKKLISDFWAGKVDSIANGLKIQECKMFK
ncbi:hypothetical protein FGO68_gene1083 [Halteria grandinella]|uniref:GST C-terminal domain-containing protein n=1 Tax=Halteria grandinella TaxID=5974 RepID=A0A8J8NNX9_HALGN|nr:hypothetical protein FGO68_gene1083 [Halteria grandinella]